MKLTAVALLAVFAHAALACNNNCEEEVTYYRYKLVNSEIQPDKPTEDFDPSSFEPEEFTLTAVDGVFLNLDKTGDSMGPKARISWNDNNSTFCLTYFDDFFHNPEMAWICRSRDDPIDIRYGTTCEEYDLRSLCTSQEVEYFLVVNEATSLHGAALRLATIVAVLLSVLSFIAL